MALTTDPEWGEQADKALLRRQQQNIPWKDINRMPIREALEKAKNETE